MSSKYCLFMTPPYLCTSLYAFCLLFLTVEGHSVYIRNLPLSVTASQLESEFQKFGAIKPHGVQVRGNKVSIIASCSAFFNLNIILISTLHLL